LTDMGHRIPLKSSPGFPTLPIGICIDGSDEGMPAAPRELLEQGKFSNATSFDVVTKDEGSMFAFFLSTGNPNMNVDFPLTHQGVKAMLDWLFPSDALKIMTEYYDSNADTMLDHIITDGVFLCSNRYTASKLAHYGKGKSYLIQWEAMFAGIMQRAMGVPHAESVAHAWYNSETRDTFSVYTFDKNPEQRALALWLSCAAARLAHCGDPNGCSGSPEIPTCLVKDEFSKNFPSFQQYSNSTDERLVVESSASMILPGQESASAEYRPFSDVQKHRCDFWDKMKFPFLNSYYNDKTKVDARCLGNSPIAGSEAWYFCEDGMHACGKQCCCDKGSQRVNHIANGPYCTMCAPQEGAHENIVV